MWALASIIVFPLPGSRSKLLLQVFLSDRRPHLFSSLVGMWIQNILYQFLDDSGPQIYSELYIY